MNDILNGLDLSDEVKTELTSRLETAKTEWIEGAKNDPEFIGNLRKEEAAKFFKSNEKIFKKYLDVSFDDLDTDLKGLKRQEAILKMGLESLQSNKDATSKEWQDKYIQASSEFENYKNEVLPSEILKVKKQYQAKFLDDWIFQKASSIDATCENPAKPALIKAYANEKGHQVVWDEDKGTGRFTIDGNLAVLVNDKPVNADEYAKMALDYMGVLKKSNGVQTDLDTPSTPTKSNGKLSANAEAMLASFK